MLAPPTGLPIGTTLVTGPPPPPRRRWLIPVIIVGSLAFLGLIVGVTLVALQVATSISQSPFSAPVSAPGGELDDLLEGDPGSPVAVDPLDCAVCFEIDDARTLALPAEAYAEVGLGNGDDETDETTARQAHLDESKGWNTDGGTPDQCYFTYPTAPLHFVPGDPITAAAERDLVYYPEWHFDESEYYLLTEAIRVFDESTSATAYLAGLESAVGGCPTYTFSETGWSTVVTATPALDLPDSVAAYGWAESAGLNRFYGVDLQRGNLVVRLTLTSDPDGPTEAEFRHLAEAYAVVLSELDPEG
ncbi:MAG TPA: hypothetical protein VNS80_01195 [Pseudolysinimonas sp.]|nr:hypothetical protein [Pseudolysinimonas sp.]